MNLLCFTISNPHKTMDILGATLVVTTVDWGIFDFYPFTLRKHRQCRQDMLLCCSRIGGSRKLIHCPIGIVRMLNECVGQWLHISVALWGVGSSVAAAKAGHCWHSYCCLKPSLRDGRFPHSVAAAIPCQ